MIYLKPRCQRLNIDNGYSQNSFDKIDFIFRSGKIGVFRAFDLGWFSITDTTFSELNERKWERIAWMP